MCSCDQFYVELRVHGFAVVTYCHMKLPFQGACRMSLSQAYWALRKGLTIIAIHERDAREALAILEGVTHKGLLRRKGTLGHLI